MKKHIVLFCLSALLSLFAFGCGSDSEDSESDSLTGVSISGSGKVKTGKTATLKAVPTKTGNPSITYTWSISAGETGSTLDKTDGESVTVTAGATTGTVTIGLSAKATIDGTEKTVEAENFTIEVTEAETISASDTPTGWASYGYTTSPYYTGSNTITINASESNAASTLLTYVKKGNYVIYINGMIDMTYNDTYGGSMLPSAWNDDNAALGKFIAAKTDNTYSSWSAWRSAYAKACDSTSHYTTGTYTKKSTSALTSGTNDATLDGYQTALATAWKKLIQLPLASNTTIIGLTDSSGIRGANISISGVSNIILRNLHLQDAFDPFPHHEYNDGWNAEYDSITIQNTNSYIWIDHCTFEDTISVGWTNFAGVNIGSVGSGGETQAYDTSNSAYEMWQTYDGLCDIKGKASNVTVSYCLFRNHDKTMLLGSDDTEKYNSVELDDTAKTITLHHNFFDGCVQRLPFVRTAHIHIFNNYFKHDGTNSYDQKASVQIRAKAWVISEYNNFGSGITYRYKGDSATQTKGYTSNTKLYDANNTGVSSEKDTYWTSVTEKPFDIEYSYNDYLDSASDVPSIVEENAGAGVCTVVQ